MVVLNAAKDIDAAHLIWKGVRRLQCEVVSQASHTHTDTHTHSLSHTHTHTLSLSLSLSHTHTHTHTLSLSLSINQSHASFHSFSALSSAHTATPLVAGGAILSQLPTAQDMWVTQETWQQIGTRALRETVPFEW